MLRLALALPLLLALPLAAADVPLSDRPVAPLAANAVVASASPDAVLIVFSDGKDVYAQRLRHDGSPIDPTAFSIASGSGARAVWDGARWLVFLTGPSVRLVRIDPAGGIDGPHPLDLKWFYDVAVVGGRTILAVLDWVTDPAARLSLVELVGSALEPAGPTLRVHDPRRIWAAMVNGAPAFVTHQWVWGDDPFLSTRFTVATATRTTELTVPTTASAPNAAFVASRASGGLLLWNDGGMRGAIVSAEGTISTPFPIGPAGTVREEILTASHEGGFDVLFRTPTETWIARVSESGAVDARPLDADVSTISSYAHALMALDGVDLLIGPRGAPGRGVSVRRIEGRHVGAASVAGLGAAAQSGAQAASGAGVDLVVWIEQGLDGLLLKATRVGADGLPLDGAGILVSDQGLFDWSHYEPARRVVAFDGEAFVLAWIEHQESGPRIVMRRIFADGHIAEPVVLAAWHAIGDVDLVGVGSGRSVVSWVGSETEASRPHSVLSVVDSGTPRLPVEVGSGDLGSSLPRLAASEERILAVFNDYVPCQITCVPENKSYGRMFTLDGAPLGDAKLLSAAIGWVPEAVSDGEDFFAVWQETLVRIRPDFSIGPEVQLARGGDLSIEEGELVVDHGITRAVYSRSGTLLRFEPHGVQKGEAAAARLSRDRMVMSVPAHPTRLMIRSLADLLQRTADLAVVATGATAVPWPGSEEANAIFRIEHRGGAPVRRIELWADGSIFVPGQDFGAGIYQLLDRALREGESFEVAVRFYPKSPSWAQPRLWAAGDAVDAIPANNTDAYVRPARPRARPVGR